MQNGETFSPKGSVLIEHNCFNLKMENKLVFIHWPGAEQISCRCLDCLLPLLHFVAADVVTFRHTQLLHIYLICLGVAQFNMLYKTHISPIGLDTKSANYILTGKLVDFPLDTLLQFFFVSFNWKKKKFYSKRKKILVSCSCCCSRRLSYRERRSTKEIQHLLSESASSILKKNSWSSAYFQEHFQSQTTAGTL